MDVSKRGLPFVREGEAGRGARGREGGRAGGRMDAAVAVAAGGGGGGAAAGAGAAVAAASCGFLAGQGLTPLFERSRLEHVG